MSRPRVLKRLYVAIFSLVCAAFILVAAATIWWWLSPQIALVGFFCLGVFPVAFYTLLGTTVMDPGKTEGGGLIDRQSPRFVDRFGRALLPLVIFSAVFGGIVASWWIPNVRTMTLKAATSLGFDAVASVAILDESPDVALASCQFLQETRSSQPIGAIQTHLQREPDDGPDVIDCLATLPGGRFESHVAAMHWYQELEGTPEDDRACRLTNRLRLTAEIHPDPAQMWLLEMAVSGSTPATRACSAQAIGALGRANKVPPSQILSSSERVSRSPLRHHADLFLSAAFDPNSTEPLVEFAAWDAPEQKQWSLDFACESLNATRTRLVDKKLDAFLSDQCGFEASDRVFERMCNQEIEGVDPLDLCGRVLKARQEDAFIEARGAVWAGMTQGTTDDLLRRIIMGAGVLAPKDAKKAPTVFEKAFGGKEKGYNYPNSSLKFVETLSGGKMGKDQMGALFDMMGTMMKKDDALQTKSPSDKRTKAKVSP